MAGKIAFIGDRDSIMAFKVLGVEVYEANEYSQAAQIATDLAEKEYAIIYITEQLAADMEDIVERYSERKLPAIIPVPSVSGKNGIGMHRVVDSVKRAVGIDLFGFDDQDNRKQE